MIAVEHVETWGFAHAIRGMRNPKNSWHMTDTIHGEYYGKNEDGRDIIVQYDVPHIGQNDLQLMKSLAKAGVEHRTYARMIQVSMDIVAPLYWWKEMDRYTVGKSQVSCSTMHKIVSKEFEINDFSHEHVDGELVAVHTYQEEYATWDVLKLVVDCLNWNRRKYLETKDKKYWWQIIQLLPSSYNQRRTVCMSYEVVLKIIKERTGHKLDEWNTFVEMLRELPYIEELVQ